MDEGVLEDRVKLCCSMVPRIISEYERYVEAICRTEVTLDDGLCHARFGT
jgi:hypothetical protein